MRFIEWIEKYKGKNSIRGDFAEDILTDEDFPDTDNKEEILNYIETQLIRHNNTQAFSTFKRMYADYSKATNSK